MTRLRGQGATAVDTASPLQTGQSTRQGIGMVLRTATEALGVFFHMNFCS